MADQQGWVYIGPFFEVYGNINIPDGCVVIDTVFRVPN